jgi:hypothetical protein
MPQIRFCPSLAMDYEIRQRALKEGRSNSDVVYRLVERGLEISPGVTLPEEAHVDRVERGAGGSKATACYLSGPISGAVNRLARDEQRSASWIVRDLLRTELRRRGILPTPAEQPSNSAA